MVVPSHPCAAHKADGSPCLAAPIRDAAYCWAHNPDTREAAQEARRLGGYRRRREAVVTSSFDLDGVHSTDDLARVLEIAITDTLALPNSIQRNRTLAQLILAGLRLYAPADPPLQVPDCTRGHTGADTATSLALPPPCPTTRTARDVSEHKATRESAECPDPPATSPPASRGEA